MSEHGSTIKVALADDHILLRDALASLINTFENCMVLFTASNGKEAVEKIKNNQKINLEININLK